MVQVRCPDCGYLQSLSDERFLNISEDFLNCPHCHAKIPKTWKPVEVESIPEEVRHKILAFSSRILNGGGITREVVCALESLVRKYGALENSVRALGLGYASVGEAKKAEEFLTQVHNQDSNDKDVLQALLKVYLAQEKYPEAIQAGSYLAQTSEPTDGDIGRLGLALIRVGREEEARHLFETRPAMDNKNPALRKARRELNGGSSLSLGAILGGKVPFNKIFSMSGREGLKALRSRARLLVSSPRSQLLKTLRGTTESKSSKENESDTSVNLESALWIGHCEYWVYSPTSTIPSWDNLKRSFLQQPANRQNRSRELQTLENLIARQKLTIDYILREEAGELFDYPAELIELNARELGAADYGILNNAQMIIRITFSDVAELALENIIFLTKFVEAIRDVSGGVIQDAISHALWGRRAWERHLYDDGGQLVQSNILLELLDEDGGLWAHSHGMQKFGLPDVELEGVPKELGGAAAKLVLGVCETLVNLRTVSSIIPQPIHVHDSSVLCAFEYRKSDTEGHFPQGSFQISPYMDEGKPKSRDSLCEALKFFNRLESQHQDLSGEKHSVLESSQQRVGILSPDLIELRRKILEAHKTALSSLDIFRKSFQDSSLTGEQVHAVKVGFPANGGQYEWMWVSLDAWTGKSLDGFLENAPVLRKDLQKGAKVSINEAEIFDWVIANGANILEGGFTEKVTHDN
ncbi:MAG: DUF2314 domain-containing protein [Deltaproteobacteria bacterium]|nr:DUF2314 domain-containing protein [Deltaproteobacteria bacterium]